MNPLEEYLGRVREALSSAESHLSMEGVAEARRLVDHGEPAEGMCILAWVIVNEDARVPRRLIDEIKYLAGEIVRSEDMPAMLDRHGLDG